MPRAKASDRRRGQGSGSVYQRASDGKWVGQVDQGWYDGRRQRKYVVRATEAAAIAALNELLVKQQRGQLPVGKSQTLAEYLPYWLEQIAKPELRPRTYDDYKTVVDVHLVPTLGKYRIDRLKPDQVQALLNAKTRDGLAPRTVGKIRAVLRAALNQAMRWDLITRNVATLVKAPSVRPFDGNPLTPSEAKRFLDAARDHRLYALFATTIALGLREGEAFGLRWQDVHLTAGTLRIVQQFHASGSTKGTFAPPKTDRSTRPLPIPEALVSILATHKQRQTFERSLAGGRWKEHDLVFCTTIGTPLNPPNMLKQYRQLLRDGGLDDQRTFHDLRRSCASLLAAWKVPPVVVKDILGHSKITTTLEVYTRAFSDDLREATSMMDDILGPPRRRQIVRNRQPPCQPRDTGTVKTMKRERPKIRKKPAQ